MKMSFIVRRNVFVTFFTVFIGSVLNLSNDFNSSHAIDANGTAYGIGYGNDSAVLPRRKRYVAFPEGSSFSLAFCLTIGMIGNPQTDFMSWALNWGVAYDLPNQTWIIEHRNRKIVSKPIAQRRHRRDLYSRLEMIIDNMGYNGRECILRALCESAQFFYKRGTNMVEELIHTVFYMPSSNVLSFEDDDLNVYDAAHRAGKNNVYCSAEYTDCGISLIQMALGQMRTTFNFM